MTVVFCQQTTPFFLLHSFCHVVLLYYATHATAFVLSIYNNHCKLRQKKYFFSVNNEIQKTCSLLHTKLIIQGMLFISTTFCVRAALCILNFGTWFTKYFSSSHCTAAVSHRQRRVKRVLNWNFILLMALTLISSGCISLFQTLSRAPSVTVLQNLIPALLTLWQSWGICLVTLKAPYYFVSSHAEQSISLLLASPSRISPYTDSWLTVYFPWTLMFWKYFFFLTANMVELSIWSKPHLDLNWLH